MLLFWITLHVLLHQGNTLAPVVTVQLGQPVTLTCSFTESLQSTSWIHWYKQTAGDTLKVISMLRKNTSPIYGPGFNPPNFETMDGDKMTNLTILKTALQDEGMYHCALMGWLNSTWNGTYLSLKESSDTTSSYRVVQHPAVLDPSQPENSKTLQCSLLSQPGPETCTGNHSVFWFKAGTEKSFPDLIYTDGKTTENCEKTSNTQKKCGYSFSKNITSSDVGTYYCAVATCGRILFGNGSKVEIAHSFSFEIMLLVITVICLAFSVIVNIVLVCRQTQKTSRKNFRDKSPPKAEDNNSGQLDDITEDGDRLNYAALHFSAGMKNKRELKTEESVYSDVREFI